MKRERMVPVVLMAAMVVVGAWEVMAHWSAKPRSYSQEHARRLEGFFPASRAWSARPRDDIEADHPMLGNIFTYELRPADGSGVPLIARLVLGYNMRDCMRYRGYRVDLVSDTATNSEVSAQGGTTGASRIQLWRLTSPLNETEIWATMMLKSADYAGTDLDTRDMAFPRIADGLDPNWVPRGFSIAGLRHPVSEIRNFMINKWNASRCDLLAFLKLKPVAWVEEDLMTLVVHTRGRSVGRGEEGEAVREVLAALEFMHSSLTGFRAQP